MTARRSDHHPHTPDDVVRVTPCGDGFVYGIGDRKLGLLAPKSAGLDRQLRSIPGVRIVDSEPGTTSAIFPAICLVAERAACLAHRDPLRAPYAGPTVALRRGRLW
jgi:hypothetical protein